MGFLMSAYGKLMTGKLVRDLEFRLMSVTRRASKITKEIQEKEKYYQAQERNMKQQMQNQIMFGTYGAAQALGIPVMPGMGMQGANMMGYNMMNMAYGGALNMLQGGQGAFKQQDMLAYQQVQQAMQWQFSQANTMWQNIFEMERDADLQALKDIQDELETEKLSLESRINLAKEENKYYKESEKGQAKDLVPEPSQG